MSIKEHDDCFFCDSNPETIEHFFWYCDRIFPLANWIWLSTEIEMEFSLESPRLGCTNCMPCKNAINCVILVVKFFIYNAKWKDVNPVFVGVQSSIKFH